MKAISSGYRCSGLFIWYLLLLLLQEPALLTLCNSCSLMVTPIVDATALLPLLLFLLLQRLVLRMLCVSYLLPIVAAAVAAEANS